MAKKIAFFDAEVCVQDKKIKDIGVVFDNAVFHSTSVFQFNTFIENVEYLCGHNCLNHDLNYLTVSNKKIIDTLPLSALLFPKHPYHRLLKDDKLQIDELNNPVNDSKKAKELFYDEINAFYALSETVKMIYYALIYRFKEFRDFFDYLDYRNEPSDLIECIQKEYNGKICCHANLKLLIEEIPVELAYSLALIQCNDDISIIPPWLLHHYPKIESCLHLLCNTPCIEGCSYCDDKLNIYKGLKSFFNYDSFRTFKGDKESLQENAVKAAVQGQSLLAIFPTGGGKSITFQLPALIAGKTTHGLTVVISPLQSLMKDQVDSCISKGIDNVVAINGLMNPIERSLAMESVRNGKAYLLYISPEQLRSKTIEKLILSRTIIRFVIDEAHCFSAWGQDFRVDYLYIADFINKIQKIKNVEQIPVSCFTATAKQKVITDIRDYFFEKCNCELKLFASSSTRENLHYTVYYQEDEKKKYNTLRRLIEQKNCSTIVYVSRTKRTQDLAERLSSDGFLALPYNGKMKAEDKIKNQEAFMNNEVSIIVATSAFGMGVDKSDVKLVIHYDISDSLESYIQEAGRAGRDQSIQAECYVLFNDQDLDKHFILLNQTKISMNQIQQVWKAIKDLTKKRSSISCSALEIARQAGWDEAATSEIETRVKTALAALENAGYIQRGQNMPKVYATSIRAENMIDASNQISISPIFDERQKQVATRIIKSLISSRSIAKAGNDDAESRVDYLADLLGLEKQEVIESIHLMQQAGLLEDYQDMSAYINDSDTYRKSSSVLENFGRLERFIYSMLQEEKTVFEYKSLNEAALEKGIEYSTVKNLKTLFYFLSMKDYIDKQTNGGSIVVTLSSLSKEKLIEKMEHRLDFCHFILETLYGRIKNNDKQQELKEVEFSLVGLVQDYKQTPRLTYDTSVVTIKDGEEALLYLSKIGALKLEGGFLVLYNGMKISRLIKDNRIRYKNEDYRTLDEFYKQRIQQIHIVGEYAHLMVKNYDAALQFVHDYFNMDFEKFIAKYFKEERAKEIERNMTPERYDKLFGGLSYTQRQIIDNRSRCVVVVAGPGSGKTKVLVHKLASLYQLEDVKHDQMLMLTFSRAASTEFKRRLYDLIGNAANFIDIKTFHSYCFDLLGRIGTLENSANIVKEAVIKINSGEVEQAKITKTVLVIDEAQDMDEDEFSLVCALIKHNENMRIVAVGDDDQNIYEFRGSSSIYLEKLLQIQETVKIELVTNYRSKANLVAFSNQFCQTIKHRMKEKQIEAYIKDNGVLKITKHTSNYMEEALVQEILHTYQGGNACVFTNTNEESLTLLGLLTKNGIKAKLIQSLDGFRLYNLIEIRQFLKYIKNDSHSPIISKENWVKAKEKLIEKYKNSTCLDNILRCLNSFENSQKELYYSDFESFLYESNYEDFYPENEKGLIFISTIHKSKGREFEAVYMLLKDCFCKNDEEKRKIYVGLTRSKSFLSIHTNTDLFSSIKADGIVYRIDNKIYQEPTVLIYHTSHKDVFLDYFKDRKKMIFTLKSGDPLEVEKDYFVAMIDGKKQKVAKFSKAFVSKINQLKEKGYIIKEAKIQFIVAWKKENEEIPVILADISFIKSRNA